MLHELNCSGPAICRHVLGLGGGGSLGGLVPTGFLGFCCQEYLVLPVAMVSWGPGPGPDPMWHVFYRACARSLGDFPVLPVVNRGGTPELLPLERIFLLPLGFLLLFLCHPSLPSMWPLPNVGGFSKHLDLGFGFYSLDQFFKFH